MKPEEIAALARALAPLLACEIGRVAYSVDESAVRAGCGRDLIYSEIRSGRLPSLTVGTRRLVRRDALEAWALAREREVTS